VKFILRQVVWPGPVLEIFAFGENGVDDFEGFGVIFWKVDAIFATFREVRRGETAAEERGGVDEEILWNVKGVMIW
jgi:hypothetical protein